MKELYLTKEQWEQLIAHGKLFFNAYDVYHIDVVTKFNNMVVIHYFEEDRYAFGIVKEII